MSSVGSASAKPNLGLAKRILEFNAILRHARENVIAGAVQNPAESLNVIADEAIPQSADDRNAPANAGFESQADFLQLRRLHQTETIHGQHSLVGGHNVFATLERSLDKTSCRLDPSDQFHHQIATVLQHFVRLRGKKCAIHAVALFFEIANQNLRDTQLDARALADERLIPTDKLYQAAANGSATQQSDFQFTNSHIQPNGGPGVPARPK